MMNMNTKKITSTQRINRVFPYVWEACSIHQGNPICVVVLAKIMATIVAPREISMLTTRLGSAVVPPSAEPVIQMLGDKGVVMEVEIGSLDPIGLLHLPW